MSKEENNGKADCISSTLQALLAEVAKQSCERSAQDAKEIIEERIHTINECIQHEYGSVEWHFNMNIGKPDVESTCIKEKLEFLQHEKDEIDGRIVSIRLFLAQIEGLKDALKMMEDKENGNG